LSTASVNKIIERSPDAVTRLTALWAFSEAGLGGLLHAFKLPFTGLIVASFAVIIIAMIAALSANSRSILKATLIVVAVKIIASPQSPFTAHLAVLIQGIAGYLLYNFLGFRYISTLIHGAFALVYSALQKLITLTVIFGTGFWKSVDIWTGSVVKDIPFGSNFNAGITPLGFVLTLYLLLYLTAGLLAGYAARRIPDIVHNSAEQIFNEYHQSVIFEKSVANIKKSKIKRYFSFFILAVIAVTTYSLPLISSGNLIEGIMIFIRAAAVILLWIYFLSPLLKKLLRIKILRKVRSEEIDTIISSFPAIRAKSVFAKEYSRKYNGIRKIKFFLSALIVTVLFDEE